MIVALPWHKAHVRGKGVVGDFGHRMTKNGQKLYRGSTSITWDLPSKVT